MNTSSAKLKLAPRRGASALFALSLLAAASAQAAFDSGSTGADGALNPTVNTEIVLPASGVLNYTSINIPAGVTVTFKKNTTNTPVYLLASGNVTIAGAIDVRGADAKSTGTYGDGALGDDGIPGVGGPGGFDGGRGGREDVAQRADIVRGGGGLGPGGGRGGIEGGNGCVNDGTSYFKYEASGGAYADSTWGFYASAYCDGNYRTNYIPSAKAYGSALLQPLIGGSGGGGGRGGTTYPGSGGGGGGSGGGGGGVVVVPPPPPAAPLSEAEVGRFLTQSTFGVTDNDISTLRSSSLSAWITQQMAMPPTALHQSWIETRTPQVATVTANQFYESFWSQAANAPDQLRQRVKFALSEIFVISLNDANIDIRGAASYYDMLGANAFGNYRNLLEQVSLHPMMGIYLTHLGNQREDPATGRHPDENYAREVMQLMSLGVYRLSLDGTPSSEPSYTADDISNLAKVFTGFSWYSPTPNNTTFTGGQRNADAAVRPMIAYSGFHSISAKTFLGVTIPATTTPDPAGDLRIALDTIFNHPNVGPFISKQLIQRLVTSNPSGAYVSRVATVFNNNGSGVRGDMAAVVRAVLTDSEARDAAGGANYGKLREPIVRVGNWMRTFNAASASGNYLITSTSANTSLSQSPLASPSVFNFYRPGYIPPNTRLGAQGLTAPEFQIVDEVSVAGYLNTLQTTINTGIGTGNDVRSAYAGEIAVAGDPAALTERMNRLLLYGSMSTGLRNRIIQALTAVAVPASTGSNQATIDAALLNRAKLAAFMTMASPEYLVQR